MAPPPIPFVFLSMAMGAMVLWIWCIIDAVRSDFKDPNQKLVWIFLLAMIPVIGVVLYLTMGQRQKTDSSSDEV